MGEKGGKGEKYGRKVCMVDFEAPQTARVAVRHVLNLATSPLCTNKPITCNSPKKTFVLTEVQVQHSHIHPSLGGGWCCSLFLLLEGGAPVPPPERCCFSSSPLLGSAAALPPPFGWQCFSPLPLVGWCCFFGKQQQPEEGKKRNATQKEYGKRHHPHPPLTKK